MLTKVGAFAGRRKLLNANLFTKIIIFATPPKPVKRRHLPKLHSMAINLNEEPRAKFESEIKD